MITEMVPALADRVRRDPFGSTFWLPLLIGLAALAIPTIANLAQQTWQLESGAHGPIVLVTAFWLIHHDGLRPSDANREGHNWPLAFAGLIFSLLTYVFGRAFDFISIEFVGLYGVFVSVLIRLFGTRRLLRHRFPLFYLALAAPPPGWLMARLTMPLQSFVSGAASHIAALLDYPIARQGVLLFVGPYQLLVEEACSGLNSLFGLTAISLLYIYLMHRASWRYSLLLLALVLPIAIVVNVIRILALVAITCRFGDAAAQGFLHMTTGLVLFAVALLLIFGLDSLIGRILRRRDPT